MTNVRIDIPPDHHPETLRGDSPGTQTGRMALRHLYEAYGKINDASNAVQDKGRLASRAQPFAETAIRRADEGLKTLHAQRRQLHGEIEAAIKPKMEPAMAAEIRTFWQGKKDRKGKLTELFGSGDAATASAILSGPAYLSGLDDKAHRQLHDLASEALAPKQSAALGETDAAIARVQRALDHFTKVMAQNIRQWRDEDEKHLEALT